MRITELLRLIGLNINQNKFKSVLTSIGIVVGAATIVLVIGIGRGGQMDIAEQFAELNAGAVDVSYEYANEEESTGGGFSFGAMGNMFGGMFGRGNAPGQDTGGNASDSGTGGNTDAGAGGFPGGMTPGGDAGTGSGDSRTGGFPGGMMPGGDAGTGSEDGSSGGFRGGGFSGEMPEGFSGEAPDGMDEDGQNAESGEDGDAAGRTNRENAETDGAEADNGTDGNAAENAEADSGAAEAGSEDGTAEAAEASEDETSAVDERLNQEKIILSQDDVEDIERYVKEISGATISYSTRASVEGANLTSAQTYTVAGVRESYESVSKLELSEGTFLTDEDNEIKSRVCVLGATVAKELFGDSEEITGSTLYIDDRTYTVIGVLEQTVTVSAGISPDTAIFIPYETGIKYVTGENISPVITVIAEDVSVLDSVIEKVRIVLEENYSNAEFTFEDSGSKMQAAQASNRTLTMLLSAMAAIVFLVGGIGIMNVLFVSVKERTNEIGILKAIGTSGFNILAEFLIESAAISCIGGILGVLISFAAVPVAEYLDVRVEVTVFACIAALGFAVLTGTVFGIYPAWKASRLEPVDALNAE